MTNRVLNWSVECLENVSIFRDKDSKAEGILTNSARKVMSHEDVLAYAGIDSDKESAFARFAPNGMTKAQLAKRASAGPPEKEAWRKAIVARIDARLAAVAASKGMTHVGGNVSELMEEALQARLKRVAEHTVTCSRERQDSNKSAFASNKVDSQPRRLVRELNLQKETEYAAREEARRQALLVVARAGGNKRKAPEVPGEALAARKLEDERVLAVTANQAARNALGLSRMDLKWAKAAKQVADRRAMPAPPFKPPFKPPFELLKRDFERGIKM